MELSRDRSPSSEKENDKRQNTIKLQDGKHSKMGAFKDPHTHKHVYSPHKLFLSSEAGSQPQALCQG